MSAHIPLVTQNNGSKRCILGYYVGFSEDDRGGILIFNPQTRTTTVRHTYKAFRLVEEQCINGIIYVIDSGFPVTMIPAQTERTQLTVESLPFPTRYTVLASNTSAAGAGIVRFFPEVYLPHRLLLLRSFPQSPDCL